MPMYKKLLLPSRILLIFFLLFVVSCMVVIGYYSSKPNTINSRAAMTCENKYDCPVGMECKNGKCKTAIINKPDSQDQPVCAGKCSITLSGCKYGVASRSCPRKPGDPKYGRYCCKREPQDQPICEGTCVNTKSECKNGTASGSCSQRPGDPKYGRYCCKNPGL